VGRVASTAARATTVGVIIGALYRAGVEASGGPPKEQARYECKVNGLIHAPSLVQSTATVNGD
jgi:hypothetical protein